MDHYFDEGLEKDVYERRKTRLLVDLKEKETAQKKLETRKGIVVRKTERFLELSKNLMRTLKIGNPEEKLELIKTVTSNLSARGKKLIVSMRSPFFELANPPDVPYGAAQGNRTLIYCLEGSHSTTKLAPQCSLS